MTGLMTVDEFLALPEKEGVKRELSDGVLIEEDITFDSAGPHHEFVKANLMEILVPFSQHVKVFAGSLFKMRNSARMPDVSLVARKRLIPGDPDSYGNGAPEIAIEVVSLETAAEFEVKLWQYFEAGSIFVWAVYPDLRCLRVFDRSGFGRLFREGQILDCPEVIPGLRVPVSRIFEGL